MALVVLSYPVIAEADLSWIQEVRAAHDPLYYEVAAPHFTFVFPVVVDREALSSHVSERVRGTPEIRFVLRCALVVKDVLSQYTHVFLVPDEGFGKIVNLHDRLYTGLLAPHLRIDIPFIPHVGIGNSIEPLACKRLADELNARDLRIEGVVRTLSIVSYEQGMIVPINSVDLG